VQLFTAFPCRFSPAAQRLKEQIEAGVLGTILAVRGTNRGLMPGGWFIEKQLSGGGAVIDHTVHVADANRWLLGKEAVEVHAEIGNGFYHQEWDDSGMLTVTYEGGVFATIDTSWSRPNNFPRGDLTLQVVGTGGVAEADLFTQNVTAYSKESAVSCHGWGSDIDEYMIRDFLRAAGGEKPEYLASGEDGLRALEVALAAYRSAQQGAPVSLTASAVH
jgi:predicted dehydrogenase